ncbi:MAG: hypothetical protein AMXMBFR48_01890 [Ignavibacteriales bacterium]
MRLSFTPLIFTQDQSGNFYLIDKNSFEIVLISPLGAEEKRTGGSGFGSSEFIDPAEILWRGNYLYILDRGSKSVKVFDRLLNFRGEQKLGNVFSASQISDPASLTVNSFGEIFITDRLSHTILAADQSFRERTDVFFIENMPGKKMRFPLKIISEKDHIAVRDSAGLFIFDRFLNYRTYIELKKTESLAGISGNFLFMIEQNTVILREISQPALVHFSYPIPDMQNELLLSPVVINKRLMYIAGNSLTMIKTDTILNEQ